MTVSRDFRWADAPRPDPDTGTAPLAPSAAANDVPGLLAEADAFGRDWRNRTLRVGLVADQALAIRRLLDRCETLEALLADARRERDHFAHRITGALAVLHGAGVAPVVPSDADAPCGWTSR